MAEEQDLIQPATGGFGNFLKSTGMPSGQEVVKKETEALERHKVERKPFLDESEALMKKMTDLSGEIEKIKTPPAPKFEKLPDAPDTQYKDPTQAIGSFASVLALMGSFKTRAPATAALNAAAAAMEAFHQGDSERVKLERDKWHDNLEKTFRQNQQEMQEYTSALEEAKFDVSKVQGKFRVIAAQNDHVAMKAAIEAGDYQAQMHIIDAGLKAGYEGAKLYVTDQHTRALIQDRRERRNSRVDEAKAAAGRAVDVIDEMQGLLQKHSGITGAMGMVTRPWESVKSFFSGDEGAAHKYESLARELQNILRQTKEFYYKGRTLSREVADRDVIVRGMKLGDTDQISSDQLQHLRNILTGSGTGYEAPEGTADRGIEYNGYLFPNQKALDDYKAAVNKSR